MSRSTIEWGAASRAKPGEEMCGDLCLVEQFEHGTLIAVIDGLGHGEEAAASAAVAERSLRVDPDEPLLSLVKRCHNDIRAERGSRGVVMSIAQIDDRQATLTWLGIGNVEGVVVQSASSRARLLNRGGVVGSALPHLRAEVLDITSGGLLVFATDGLNGAFADEMPPDARPVQDIADELMRKHARETDDALVLAARLLVNGRE